MWLKRPLAAIIPLPSCAIAPSVLAMDEAWSYAFTPCILGAGLDGTVGVRGIESDIDISFNDILDDLDLAFMGIFVARKGSWSLGVEGVYTKLEDEGSKRVTGPFGRVSYATTGPRMIVRFSAVGNLRLRMPNTACQQRLAIARGADKRKPDAEGKLPPVGTTVDVANATWTNTIGDPELINV